MIVFHGSYMEIDTIDFSKCDLNRDFGRAFYVTKFREQATYRHFHQTPRKRLAGNL
jgi:hypothetical protein